jgi:hypothetical protein
MLVATNPREDKKREEKTKRLSAQIYFGAV